MLLSQVRSAAVILQMSSGQAMPPSVGRRWGTWCPMAVIYDLLSKHRNALSRRLSIYASLCFSCVRKCADSEEALNRPEQYENTCRPAG